MLSGETERRHGIVAIGEDECTNSYQAMALASWLALLDDATAATATTRRAMRRDDWMNSLALCTLAIRRQSSESNASVKEHSQNCTSTRRRSMKIIEAKRTPCATKPMTKRKETTTRRRSMKKIEEAKKTPDGGNNRRSQAITYTS